MVVHLIVEAAHASSGCDDVGVAVVMVYVGVRHHLHFCKKKKVLIRLIDQWLAVKNGFAIGLILKKRPTGWGLWCLKPLVSRLSAHFFYPPFLAVLLARLLPRFLRLPQSTLEFSLF